MTAADSVAVACARALPWLAYHLALDHPLRAHLPAVAEAARQRILDPRCVADVGYLGGRKVPKLIAALGGDATTDQGWVRIGPVEIEAQDDWRTVRLRPALLSGPDDPALAVLRAHLEDREDAFVGALRLLLTGQLAATVAAGPDTADHPFPHDPAAPRPTWSPRWPRRTG